MIFVKDTPQSVGLPTIEEYRNDYAKFDVKVEDAEKELAGKEILFKYVLNNKFLWIIAMANLFVYLVRYGVLNWAPVYLKKIRGFNTKEAGVAFVLFEYAAIPSTIIVDWISNKVFHGRRTPAGVFCC